MADEHCDYLNVKDTAGVKSLLSKHQPQEYTLFSDLVVKINRKEKEQTRAMLVTNKAIYNLLPNNYTKCKRRIPISMLSSITVSQISDEFVLHVPDEYDYRFKSAKKDKVAEVISRAYRRIREEEAPGTLSASSGSPIIMSPISSPKNINPPTTTIIPAESKEKEVRHVPHNNNGHNKSPSNGHKKSPSNGTLKKSKLHVQYVNEADLSGITLTKQQARLQSREDILRRKQELIVEVGDNDSDAEDNQHNKNTQQMQQMNINGSHNNTPHNGIITTNANSPIHSRHTSNIGGESSNMLGADSPKVTLEDFELLKVLGRGSFGKVMLVRLKRDGKKYAMKILKKKAIIARDQVEHTKAERKILESLQHPFLMTLRFAFQSTEKLYFVLDYYQGGELFFHLKNQRRFNENVARLFVGEIALALGHLHSLGVVYRDLKPENILLDDLGHVCLTDFGLSKDLEPTDKSHTFCGTPEYLAPEIVAGLGHNQAVDWWSLGILLYELTVGIPPFYSTNVNEMYNKIQNGILRFPPFLSPECKEVIIGLLNRDPAKRLGASERDVEDIKAMAFFAPVDWNKLMKKEIDSPYRPHCHSETEAQNFDTTFTNEPVIDSVIGGKDLPGSLPSRNGITDGDDTFVDFSYVPGKNENNPLLMR